MKLQSTSTLTFVVSFKISVSPTSVFVYSLESEKLVLSAVYEYSFSLHPYQDLFLIFDNYF